MRLVRRYIPRAAEGPREVVAAEVSQTPAPTGDTETATAEAAPAIETESDLTADSPAVGSNIGGDDGSTGLG